MRRLKLHPLACNLSDIVTIIGTYSYSANGAPAAGKSSEMKMSLEKNNYNTRIRLRNNFSGSMVVGGDVKPADKAAPTTGANAGEPKKEDFLRSFVGIYTKVGTYSGNGMSSSYLMLPMKELRRLNEEKTGWCGNLGASRAKWF
jgi:hypothetical protein